MSPCHSFQTSRLFPQKSCCVTFLFKSTVASHFTPPKKFQILTGIWHEAILQTPWIPCHLLSVWHHLPPCFLAFPAFPYLVLFLHGDFFSLPCPVSCPSAYTTLNDTVTTLTVTPCFPSLLSSLQTGMLLVRLFVTTNPWEKQPRKDLSWLTRPKASQSMTS